MNVKYWNKILTFPLQIVKNVSSILVDCKTHYIQMHFKTVGPKNTECVILLAVPSKGRQSRRIINQQAYADVAR